MFLYIYGPKEQMQPERLLELSQTHVQALYSFNRPFLKYVQNKIRG